MGKCHFICLRNKLGGKTSQHQVLDGLRSYLIEGKCHLFVWGSC